MCCPKETNFRHKDICGLKMNGQEKIFHGDKNDKNAGVTVFKLDKLDFNTEKVSRDRGHYTMIKASVQEDKTIVSFCAPKYIKQMLTDIEGEIDHNTISEYFNNLHT